MKFLPSQLIFILLNRTGRRHLAIIFWYLILLALLVVAYTSIFLLLMDMEGREYSWTTGFYWTLTVMSTLGFGDITFENDIGRVFSMIVLLSGVISLLVVLPFTFIEFFYEPWMRAHTAARVPRELPKDCTDHVILTHFDIVSKELITKLVQYNTRYVLILEDLDEALKFYDLGYQVILGELNNPETFKNARVGKSAMVVATGPSILNTSIAFTVREINTQIPVVTTTNKGAARETLHLAGATHIINLGEMMGMTLARRTNGGDAMSHMVGNFDSLHIAEATPASVMIGKTVKDLDLEEKVGVTILGFWERGQFKVAAPETVINQNNILLLAGTKEQLKNYDVLFCIYNVPLGPVIIIGAGRVGRAAAKALAKRDLDYRIVDKNPDRTLHEEQYILGDASDANVLKKAGIMESPSVIIATHSSSMNLYLTIFIRHLRPDIQIVTRSGFERNVEGLHKAGADFVMSYSSMGANAIFNILKESDILIVAEEFDLFKVNIPKHFVGKSLAELSIYERTGCNVIGIREKENVRVLPRPTDRLPAKGEIILVGGVEGEDKFLDLCKNHQNRNIIEEKT